MSSLCCVGISGFLSTAGILTAGVLSMGSGNKKKQQQLMRWRVGAQAFTVVAFLYGLYAVNRTERQTGVTRYEQQKVDRAAATARRDEE